jgi:hypothetical protein
LFYRCALCGNCQLWHYHGLIYNMATAEKKFQATDREGLALLHQIGM